MKLNPFLHNNVKTLLLDFTSILIWLSPVQTHLRLNLFLLLNRIAIVCVVHMDTQRTSLLNMIFTFVYNFYTEYIVLPLSIVHDSRMRHCRTIREKYVIEWIKSISWLYCTSTKVSQETLGKQSIKKIDNYIHRYINRKVTLRKYTTYKNFNMWEITLSLRL